jgi:hemolysin activation/secretion protein
VVVGWQGSRSDKRGLTSGSFTLIAGTAAPFMDLVEFQNNSGPSASEQFVVARVRVARDQDIFGKWKLSAAAEGQLASQALVSLEQFGIGGLGSVRGYQEGEIYGDDGFFAQFELKAPPFSRRETIDGRPVGIGTAVSFFTDYGRVFLKDPQGREPSSDLWGAGMAGSAFFGKHFETRFVLGWSLIDSNTRVAGSFLFSFSLGTQF